MMVFLVLVGAVALWAVWTRNRLITLRNQVRHAWKQIDVQLKRRHDLVPHLVAAVQRAMEFERDTVEQVMDARGRAVAAPSVAASIAAEGDLTRALRPLFAVVENDPSLRTNETVLRLRDEITTTENQLGFARQFYNDMAMRLNTREERFPASLIASRFGFQRAELFAGSDEDRLVPQIGLSLHPSR